MNHQWQSCLHRPFHLLFKSQQLFLFKLAAPIEIKPHLSDGNDFTIDFLAQLYQHISPIPTYFLRMKAQHRITKARILSADSQNRLTRFQIDTWNTNSRYPCLTGTGYNGIEVLFELLTIQMAVGIDEHQLWRFIMSAA